MDAKSTVQFLKMRCTFRVNIVQTRKNSFWTESSKGQTVWNFMVIVQSRHTIDMNPPFLHNLNTNSLVTGILNLSNERMILFTVQSFTQSNNLQAFVSSCAVCLLPSNLKRLKKIVTCFYHELNTYVVMYASFSTWSYCDPCN